MPTPEHPVTHKRPDLIEEFAGKTFVVECDGPTHFLLQSDGNSFVLNGKTIFQTALDLRRDPHTARLRLPKEVFYTHRGDQGFWDDVLVHAAEAKPCGYVVGQAGELISLKNSYTPSPDNPLETNVSPA